MRKKHGSQFESSKIGITILIILFNAMPHSAAAEAAVYSPVVISEIAAQLTSDYEWIEVCNISGTAQDLSGWKFYEEKTNHGLTAFQNDLTLDVEECAVIASKADKFMENHPAYSGTLIDSSWASLKVEGEEIGLRMPDGKMAETFTYIQISDEPIAKITLSANDYTAANWIGATETPGLKYEATATVASDTSTSSETDQSAIDPLTTPVPDSNSVNDPAIPIAPESNPTPHVPAATPGTIVINEVVSYPASGDEWIELYNNSDYEFDLTGWKMNDGAGVISTLSGIIPSHGFLTATLASAHLNNAGDIVTLKNLNGDILDSITYGTWNDDNLTDNNLPAPAKGYSLARTVDGGLEFAVTTRPTKNNPNEIIVPAAISTTTQNAGPAETPLPSKNTSRSDSSASVSPAIIVNELYPNPPGSDSENEFIELKNNGLAPLNLDGWELSVSSGGEYKLKETTILPQSFATLYRSQTHLALNNTHGTVKFFDPTGRKIDSVTYKALFDDGYSYQLIEGDWELTGAPTPGAENLSFPVDLPPVISAACDKEVIAGEAFNCDASDSFDPDGKDITVRWLLQTADGKTKDEFSGDFVSLTARSKQQKKLILYISDGSRESIKKMTLTIADNPDSTLAAATAKSADEPLLIELDEAKMLARGTKVTSRGTVSVVPGIFGEKIFYLSGSGLQIELDSGTPPKLHLGDLVAVTGTVRERESNSLISLSDAQNIRILDQQPPPSPVPIRFADVAEKYEGYLITVSGTISEINRAALTLAEDGRTLKVPFKRGAHITCDRLSAGDRIHLTGILRQNGTSYELLPRSDDDIVVEPPAPGEPTILPTSTLPTQEVLTDKNPLRNLLMIIIAAGTGLLVTFIIHRKFKKGPKVAKFHFSK